MKALRTEIRKILNETLTSKVYHIVDTNNLENILKTNKINFSTHLGTDGDKLDIEKGYYFLSLSRTGSLDVGYARSQYRMARIEFDGNKLNSRFKSAPVDFWQRKDSQALMKQYGEYMHKDDLMHRAMKDFEYEDRLYSRSPELPNINKYINNIHILFDILNTNEFSIRQVQNILKYGESLNIPIYVYQNKKDFQSVKNQINDQILNYNFKEEPEEERDSFYNRIDKSFVAKVFGIILYSKEAIDDYDLLKSQVAELVKKHNIQIEIDDTDIYNIHSRISGLQYQNRDFIPSIQADIHNISKRGMDSPNRYFLDVLVKEMRKAKVHTIAEFYNLKVTRLKPKTKNPIKFSNIYTLAYKPYYDDEDPQRIDNSTPIKDVKGMYFANQYISVTKQEFNDIWELLSENKTAGDYINFMLNTYYEDKALKILSEMSESRIVLLKK